MLRTFQMTLVDLEQRSLRLTLGSEYHKSKSNDVKEKNDQMVGHSVYVRPS